MSTLSFDWMKPPFERFYDLLTDIDRLSNLTHVAVERLTKYTGTPYIQQPYKTGESLVEIGPLAKKEVESGSPFCTVKLCLPFGVFSNSL
jgi:hypothetical protein